MFDLSIYYKNGNRSYIDHVTGIDWNGDKVGIQTTTDFDDKLYREIKAAEIDRIGVKICIQS